MIRTAQGYLRGLAKKISLKDSYKELITSLTKKTGSYAIDRDGDLFTVKCPSCSSPNVFPFGSTFVCSRRHVFAVYTEDGIREVTEENKKRIIGEDLQKNGEDSHGHGSYVVYPPDEKALVYLHCWLENKSSITPQDVTDEVWRLFKAAPMVRDTYLDYTVEVNVMRGGAPSTTLASTIKTWPKEMNNRRWFLLMNELEPTEWGIDALDDSQRD